MWGVLIDRVLAPVPVSASQFKPNLSLHIQNPKLTGKQVRIKPHLAGVESRLPEQSREVAGGDVMEGEQCQQW